MKKDTLLLVPTCDKRHLAIEVVGSHDCLQIVMVQLSVACIDEQALLYKEIRDNYIAFESM